MSDKGLLINAIDLVEIDQSTNIPTALYYRKGQTPAIGSEALALKQARRELNEDFKIDDRLLAARRFQKMLQNRSATVVKWFQKMLPRENTLRGTRGRCAPGGLESVPRDDQAPRLDDRWARRSAAGR